MKSITHSRLHDLQETTRTIRARGKYRTYDDYFTPKSIHRYIKHYHCHRLTSLSYRPSATPRRMMSIALGSVPGPWCQTRNEARSEYMLTEREKRMSTKGRGNNRTLRRKTVVNFVLFYNRVLNVKIRCQYTINYEKVYLNDVHNLKYTKRKHMVLVEQNLDRLEARTLQVSREHTEMLECAKCFQPRG